MVSCSEASLHLLKWGSQRLSHQSYRLSHSFRDTLCEVRKKPQKANVGCVAMNQEFLKQTLLFKDLTEDELVEIILIGHLKKFKANQIIFEEGDPGDDLFLIVDGSVRISKIQNKNEEALAILESKSFFGEMTLLDRQPRSAWAIAHEDTSIFIIPTEKLIDIFEKNLAIGYKFLWAFSVTLAKRLRSTNDKISIIMSLANTGF